MLDRIYVYFKTRNDGKGEPEFRLREWASMHCAAARAHDTAASMVPGTILLPAGLIVTGWAAQKGVHWIVVDIVSAVSPHHSLADLISCPSGPLPRRRGHDPQLPVHPDVCHRCVHAACGVRPRGGLVFEIIGWVSGAFACTTRARALVRRLRARLHDIRAFDSTTSAILTLPPTASASRSSRRRCTPLWASGGATPCWRS